MDDLQQAWICMNKIPVIYWNTVVLLKWRGYVYIYVCVCVFSFNNSKMCLLLIIVV